MISKFLVIIFKSLRPKEFISEIIIEIINDKKYSKNE
jgi:hypothetical protein